MIRKSVTHVVSGGTTKRVSAVDVKIKSTEGAPMGKMKKPEKLSDCIECGRENPLHDVSPYCANCLEQKMDAEDREMQERYRFL